MMKNHTRQHTFGFNSLCWTTLVAVLVCFASWGRAGSVVLVEDTFTNAGDGTFVVHAASSQTPRTPETTIDTRPWLQSNTTSDGTLFESSVSGGQAQLETNLGAAVDITSTGSYAKPTVFDIAFMFNIDGVTNNSPPRDGRGAYLGFWSALPSSGDSIGNMRGVFVNPENGELHLWGGDSLSTNPSLEALAYNGTWDASANHTMSYRIDTTTGDITDFILDSTSYDWSATTIFSDANTQYAGFGISAAAADESGSFDDFQLSTIPTPAALPAGLMLMGLLTLRRGNK